MKITLLFILALSTLTQCFKPLHAAEYSLSVFQNSHDADQDKYSVGSWYGTQFSYAPHDKGYFFVSQETAEVSPMGHAFDYHITMLGVGSKWEIVENVKIMAQIGYGIVKNTMGRTPATKESIGYYLNDKFHDATGSPAKTFDEYMVENSNTFGATIGAQLHQPISKNWSADFTYAYRIMQISETIRGMKNVWNYDTTGVCWETHSNRNYSSHQIWAGINYKF